MRSKTPLSLTLPPPDASGTTSDDHPSSAPRRHRSGSYPTALSARARNAVGGHSASRNLRVVSARSSWSELRSNTGGNPQAWLGPTCVGRPGIASTYPSDEDYEIRRRRISGGGRAGRAPPGGAGEWPSGRLEGGAAHRRHTHSGVTWAPARDTGRASWQANEHDERQGVDGTI